MTSEVMERFWSKVEIRSDAECWTWRGAVNRDGYGRFHAGIQVRAHRWIYEQRNGPVSVDLSVMHMCDNPPCVNPSHLRIGTNAENTADRHAKGRDASGERHGSSIHPERWLRGDANPARMHPERMTRGEDLHLSKLTEQAVREIRERYAAGEATQQALADEYGVKQTTVGNVVRRVTWKHVASVEHDHSSSTGRS